MAGFEVVVRPAIFPDIRPPVARSAAPQESDPDKNIAVIHGASGGPITLPFSWSVSSSKNKQNENKRRVDIVRVYQKDEDGEINPDNYVELEVANKIWMDEYDPSGKPLTGQGILGGNVDPFSVNALVGVSGTSTSSQKVQSVQDYAPVEAEDHIEIQERNVIRRNPNAS